MLQAKATRRSRRRRKPNECSPAHRSLLLSLPAKNAGRGKNPLLFRRWMRGGLFLHRIENKGGESQIPEKEEERRGQKLPQLSGAIKRLPRPFLLSMLYRWPHQCNPPCFASLDERGGTKEEGREGLALFLIPWCGIRQRKCFSKTRILLFMASYTVRAVDFCVCMSVNYVTLCISLLFRLPSFP